jgi:hypothetical protein
LDVEPIRCNPGHAASHASQPIPPIQRGTHACALDLGDSQATRRLAGRQVPGCRARGKKQRPTQQQQSEETR